MAKIKLSKLSVYVTPVRQDEHKVCKLIPGAAWRKEHKLYQYPMTSLQSILAMFFKLPTIEHVKKAVEEGQVPMPIYEALCRVQYAADMAQTLKKSGPRQLENKGFLFIHQQLCREIAAVNPRYAFFCEAGTGKTPMSLQIIYDDIQEGLKNNEERKWLVICPLSLINPAWIADAKKFFPSLRIVNLHGGTPARTKKAFETPADIYVINFDSFKVHQDKLMAMKFNGVVVDESSKMKNHQSQITKCLLEFSKYVERWYELSGTPAPNSMMEYFAQMKAIDPTLLGSSFSNFKSKWFYSISHGGFEAYDITDDNKYQLTKLIEKKAIFIAKDDCLDLPDKVFLEREIEMPKDLRKMYKQMKYDLYCQIGEDLMVTATTSVTSLGKLNQLTSGILIDSTTGEVHRVSDAKIKLLVDVLEEIGPNEPAVIWANYHGEFLMIKEKLGDKAVTYYGATSTNEVQPLVEKHYGPKAFDKFKEEGLSIKDMAAKLFREGKVQYIIANPASAGHGLTWTHASYAIYYSMNYSYEQWSQSQDRLHRYSQTRKCTYVLLLMKGTIDYAIYNCVMNKGDLSSAVLNHLKAEAIRKDESDDS